MHVPLLAIAFLGCRGELPVACPAGSVPVGTLREGVGCEDEDGKKVGPHVRDWPDGTPRERGQHGEAGHRTGTWTRFHENGQKAREEAWVDGFMDGAWAEWDADGNKRLSGAFVQGRRDGKWWDWGEDGQPRELTTWSDGVMAGPAVAWFDDGDLKQVGHHEAGVPVGLWMVMHETGGVASVTPWLKGSKHGAERVWTPGGRLTRETMFEAGAIRAEQTWHLSGSTARRRAADGSDLVQDRDGNRLKWCRPGDAGVLCEEWYADGTPKARFTLVERRKHGAYAAWHPDGSPAAEGAYSSGRREGRWVFRRGDGSVDGERSGMYTNGARAGGRSGG